MGIVLYKCSNWCTVVSISLKIWLLFIASQIVLVEVTRFSSQCPESLVNDALSQAIQYQAPLDVPFQTQTHSPFADLVKACSTESTVGICWVCLKPIILMCSSMNPFQSFHQDSVVLQDYPNGCTVCSPSSDAQRSKRHPTTSTHKIGGKLGDILIKLVISLHIYTSKASLILTSLRPASWRHKFNEWA